MAAMAMTRTRGNRRDDDKDKARLFIIIGDNGRRGQTQNLEDGPFGPGIPDDQFGGPEPDNAHLTGVVLRLNDDGTTPRDNPFFELGRRIGGQVGANIQKIFAYGIRNSFGMAVDPRTGVLWNQENGDDSFDEINRITAGQNNGWVQVMGPVSRVAEFKMIETRTAVLRLAADPVAADQHRRHPGRGAERVSSCSEAPTTAIRSFPGSSRSRRPGSGFSPAGHSGASTMAICSSARR